MKKKNTKLIVVILVIVSMLSGVFILTLQQNKSSVNTKEYMINNHIQIIKGKGPILLYNQEDNNFKIKAKLELIKEVMVSETEKKQEVVKVIEIEEIRPGYYIDTIEVKDLEKGFYPTKVEIIKVMWFGREETLDRMGLMIEIRD